MGLVFVSGVCGRALCDDEADKGGILAISFHEVDLSGDHVRDGDVYAVMMLKEAWKGAHSHFKGSLPRVLLTNIIYEINS